jgi:hypothetical protein
MTRPKSIARFAEDARRRPGLELAQRLAILQQASVLLDSIYVHLPLKRAMFGIDPVQQLRALRCRMLDPLLGDGPIAPDLVFHEEMLRVFAGARDRHTSYFLPDPYLGSAACLAVMIEAYDDGGEPRFVVTAVAPRIQRGLRIKAGDEVTHWNGTPIAAFVRRRAESRAQSNDSARAATALSSLTIRPLMAVPVPDEDEVILTYRAAREDGGAPPADARPLRQRLRWSVRGLSEAVALLPAQADQDDVIPADALGDRSEEPETEAVRLMRVAMYSQSPKPGYVEQIDVEQGFDTLIRAGILTVGDARCGYLRLFSFDVTAARAPAYVTEVRRVLDAIAARLPDERAAQRLIVDVRANGGGSIPLAETLLELFTERRPIERGRAQFISSHVLFQLIKRAADEGRPDLRPIAESIREAIEVGAPYSRGFPFAPPVGVDTGEPTPRGRVVLIIDGATSSAAEAFAAGFQDHAMGPVLGTSRTTSGAGAQIQRHPQLMSVFGNTKPDDGTMNPLAALPGGVNLSVAFRRMIRVRANADVPLEGYGVAADYVTTLTRHDLLHRNEDLIGKTLRVFEDWQARGPRKPGEPPRRV